MEGGKADLNPLASLHCACALQLLNCRLFCLTYLDDPQGFKQFVSIVLHYIRNFMMQFRVQQTCKRLKEHTKTMYGLQYMQCRSLNRGNLNIIPIGDCLLTKKGQTKYHRLRSRRNGYGQHCDTNENQMSNLSPGYKFLIWSIE